MIDPAFPRDLLFTGTLFGLVAFMWAGWAQERPPKGVVWRIVLVAIQAAGLVLLGIGLMPIIRNWGADSALVPGSVPFIWYMVVTLIEIVAILVVAIWLIDKKRTEVVAGPVMMVVGLHFVPLAFVFGQPILMVAAILLTAIGIGALFFPRRIAAPSFWCGLLGGIVFIGIGLPALLVGLAGI